MFEIWIDYRGGLRYGICSRSLWFGGTPSVTWLKEKVGQFASAELGDIITRFMDYNADDVQDIQIKRV